MKPDISKDNEELQDEQQTTASGIPDAVEEDGTPVLDEEDLEDNNLTVDDVENIEWEEPKSKKDS